MAEATAELSRKDLVSDQEVRWCPGCGDYAILAQMQRVLPELGIAREKMVFVSGIGCSSRFPYYMNTYGMHTIHGRAPTIATGLKVANPDLHVWVITGDGDGLSIGGNHLLHVLRRNVNLNIILFNNRIYGLTKGQYSPTSLPGTRTKTSPLGSIEQSFNPISVALAAEATFVARTTDRNTKHLADVLKRQAEHRGTSFVEIYQNCNIFNDGAWKHITEAEVKDDTNLLLEHGQPMIFGKDRDKGIRMSNFKAEVVALGNGVTEEDLLIHDETMESPELAFLLSRMEHPTHPVPLGVFRCVEHPTYEEQLITQGDEAVKTGGTGDLASLYHKADTWIVPEGEGANSTVVRDLEPEAPSSIPEIIPDINSDDPAESRSALQTRMNKRVDSLDLPTPVSITADTSLAQAIERMQSDDLGCILIVDKDGILEGIFAQGDIFTQVAGRDLDLAGTTIGQIMTRNPTTLKRRATIGHVLHLMALHGYRHIPIVTGSGQPVAMASFKDLMRILDSVDTD